MAPPLHRLLRKRGPRDQRRSVRPAFEVRGAKDGGDGPSKATETVIVVPKLDADDDGGVPRPYRRPVSRKRIAAAAKAPNKEGHF